MGQVIGSTNSRGEGPRPIPIAPPLPIPPVPLPSPYADSLETPAWAEPDWAAQPESATTNITPTATASCQRHRLMAPPFCCAGLVVGSGPEQEEERKCTADAELGE